MKWGQVFWPTLLLTFGMVKAFFIALPYHNDEVNHFGGVEAIMQNHFSPFVEWWSYHPPVVYELVAVLATVFPTIPLVLLARGIIAFFGAGTLFFTYLLAKRFYNRRAGLIATGLLFFIPIFQAQTSLFHLAVPLTFFFLATFYFYLSERWWPFLLSAIGLVLTKETGSLILFSLWLLDILSLKKMEKATFLKRAFLINFPQLFFLGWMTLNKKFLDWYLWPFNLSFFSAHKPYATKVFTGILRASFWETGSWILITSLVLGLIWAIKNRVARGLIRKEIVWGFVLLLGFGLFFTAGVYLPRYLLFTFPLALIFLAALLDKFSSKHQKFLGMLWRGLIIGVLSLHWFYVPNRPIAWAGERNFGYVTIVSHHQQVVDLVLKKYGSQRLVTHHPLVTALSKTEAGYLDSEKSLQAVDLEWMSPQEPIQGIWIISDFYQSAGTKKIWQEVERSYQVTELEMVKGEGIATHIYQVEPKTP